MSKWARAQAHAAFRFAVQIDGISEASFTECTLPPLEVDVTEEKEGGYNDGTHLLAGRIKKGSLTLKRGLAQSSELLNWYVQVMQGEVEEARRKVSITLFDSEGEQVMRWDFRGAYPSKWEGPSLNAGSDKVAIETLELSYEGVTVS